MYILRYLILLFAPLFVLVQVQGSYAASCPASKIVQQQLKKTFKRDIKVIKVEPSPVPTICEVQVNFRGRKGVWYIDQKGNFLTIGQVYRLSDGTNITRERLNGLNRFTGPEIKKLNELTAFTVNSKGKLLYLVVDPECPYCKKAEAILAPMLKKREIQLKVLFFPLSFHKGAKEQSISIICDNKGFEGLRGQYRSKNQCQKGKEKVETTINFLEHKGIRGIPTYIFTDGQYYSGILGKEALMKRLGIPVPKNTSVKKTK
ncbi:MAG: thioredoxin fold domain-containing protein [Nitrospiraceae bacterium]|nr:thioredoxin fold domain-containing protein [Nitrospiraceae bacterium]